MIGKRVDGPKGSCTIIIMLDLLKSHGKCTTHSCLSNEGVNNIGDPKAIIGAMSRYIVHQLHLLQTITTTNTNIYSHLRPFLGPGKLAATQLFSWTRISYQPAVHRPKPKSYIETKFFQSLFPATANNHNLIPISTRPDCIKYNIYSAILI